MRNKIMAWKTHYPNIYEFILFNLLANVATIVNFIVLTVCNQWLFRSYMRTEFIWGPFRYTMDNGGLCGFLSFLVSYVCAQTVNFAVQRKVVFQTNNDLGRSVGIYVLLVILVFFICLYLPSVVTQPLSRLFGAFAIYVSNILNKIIQVVILYPAMKFIIMKKK